MKIQKYIPIGPIPENEAERQERERKAITLFLKEAKSRDGHIFPMEKIFIERTVGLPGQEKVIVYDKDVASGFIHATLYYLFELSNHFDVDIKGELTEFLSREKEESTEGDRDMEIADALGSISKNLTFLIHELNLSFDPAFHWATLDYWRTFVQCVIAVKRKK